MLAEGITGHRALGADLRALRKSRGLTLIELASRLERSVGWLSQVERDISEPSLDDLRALSRVLEAPLAMLLQRAQAENDEAGLVVRKEARREIGQRVRGLTEALLSPDLTDDFEVIHSTFAPGASRAGTTRRPTQELAVMIGGRLDVSIGAHRFTVEAGDSFRIRGEPFAWANPYDQPAVAIWVIAPPVY